MVVMVVVVSVVVVALTAAAAMIGRWWYSGRLMGVVIGALPGWSVHSGWCMVGRAIQV